MARLVHWGLTIFVYVFLGYIIHAMWTMAMMFKKMRCYHEPCFNYFLENEPKMQLAIYASVNRNPISSEVTNLLIIKDFNYWDAMEQELEIDIPRKTRRNGTLYMHVVYALQGEPLDWRFLRLDKGPTFKHTMSLTQYMVPRAETYKLLGDGKEKVEKKTSNPIATATSNPTKSKPVTHIRSAVHVTLLTDFIKLSKKNIPPELTPYLQINRHKEILPIMLTDYFNTRLKDLVEVNKNTTEMKINFQYRPIGIGMLRLMVMMEHSMNAIEDMGFTKKDIDEVKGLLSQSNVYLICGTILVASVHILFDILSFKNDVSFWRQKRSYEGLSRRATMWRAFSTAVIFLYLIDENSSLLVLVPTGFGLLIELWKCKKILKLEIGFFGIRKKDEHCLNEPASEQQLESSAEAEKRTEEFDKQGMKYLTYLLYPLCLAGAAYSLIYQPHRSWYSWTLNSLVNGVYAFGFLFMLPQLFVNYKLKSVAALPWRAFMYKAFNTFIDDFFAFIITMPTAHRVACLRDDIVFLIYLYQRWLYPVDKKRIDTGLAIELDESEPDLPAVAQTEKKPKKTAESKKKK